MVKALLPQLEKEGAVTRGWLGLAAQDLTPSLGEALGLPVNKGAVVVNVDEGTPAAQAGLRPDDVIVSLDDKPITSAGSLTRTVGLLRPNEQVTLTIYRDGQKQDRQVTLGTRPDLEGLSERGTPRSQAEPHQRLGLALSDVGPQFEARGMPPGALITQVLPGSPAQRAGLAPGMVVVEAGGKPVRGAADLVRVLREGRPGSTVLLRIQVENTRLLRAIKLPE
jgi:serine protease Do